MNKKKFYRYISDLKKKKKRKKKRRSGKVWALSGRKLETWSEGETEK